MKVYIAAPYTQGAWEYNIRDVVNAAERVYQAGHYPFIPHTMTTLWALIEPKSKNEWLEFDLYWLGQCDCLIRLSGDSEGADTEVGFAESNDITVYDSVGAFLQDND